MKRMVVVLTALAVLCSFGAAGAVSVGSNQLPKHLKAVAGQYGLWWPSAIDLNIPSTSANWTWVLVVANWYGDPITINVTLTAYTSNPQNTPITESFGIAGYGKKVITPGDFKSFNFFNTIADIWVTADAPIFGGTLYLMDSNSGRLITTVPHIEIEN